MANLLSHSVRLSFHKDSIISEGAKRNQEPKPKRALDKRSVYQQTSVLLLFTHSLLCPVSVKGALQTSLALKGNPLHTHRHTHKHRHTHTHTRKHTHKHTHTRTQTYRHTHRDTLTRAQTHTYTNTHIDTQTYRHTHKCTHTHTSSVSQ